MIGFSPTLKSERVLSQESADIINMQKARLYNQVSRDYCVPPSNSRGVTKEYLVKVKNGQVFRVGVQDMKSFEFSLTPAMQRKVATISNPLIVRKLNDFLRITRNITLGFSEFECPEQTWLLRIARIIDKTNLLEIFECAAVSEPPLTDNSSIVSKVHFGRQFASEYLFRSAEFKSNKKLWESLAEVSEVYRSTTNNSIAVEVLQEDLKLAKERLETSEKVLNDLLSKTAITYSCLENPTLRGEQIMAGGDTLTQKEREAVLNNYNL